MRNKGVKSMKKSKPLKFSRFKLRPLYLFCNFSTWFVYSCVRVLKKIRCENTFMELSVNKDCKIVFGVSTNENDDRMVEKL